MSSASSLVMNNDFNDSSNITVTYQPGAKSIEFKSIKLRPAILVNVNTYNPETREVELMEEVLVPVKSSLSDLPNSNHQVCQIKSDNNEKIDDSTQSVVLPPVIDLFEYMENWGKKHENSNSCRMGESCIDSQQPDNNSSEVDSDYTLKKIKEILSRPPSVVDPTNTSDGVEEKYENIVYCLQDSLLEFQSGDLRYGFKMRPRQPNVMSSSEQNRRVKRDVNGNIKSVKHAKTDNGGPDHISLTSIMLDDTSQSEDEERYQGFHLNFTDSFLYYANRQPKITWQMNVPADYKLKICQLSGIYAKMIFMLGLCHGKS